MLRQLAFGTLMALAPNNAEAVEVSPIYGFQLLGGQSFFKPLPADVPIGQSVPGQKDTLSADASILAAPAMKFNDEWSLLPSVSSVYTGTKQVLDIVGNGSLIQEQWDNYASAKAVYSPGGGPWRFKGGGSFKYENLKETKDETWGNDLFDYYQWDGGAEVEYVYHDPFSVRVSLDYFEQKFPNYSDLESQAALAFQGQSLNRELVGNHVVDTRDVLGTIAVSFPTTDWLFVETSAMTLYQSFYNQNVVDDTGNLIQKKRQDFTTTFGLNLRSPYEFNSDLKLLGSIESSIQYTTSNQNDFDATQTFFTPYYYNYGQVKTGPGVKLFWGPAKHPAIIGLSGTYWLQRYPYRHIQDTNGTYLAKQLINQNWMSNLTVNYPMAPHFDLLFNFQYGAGHSNTSFEQFYTYNYRVATYMFGFSYDY